jgi:hypothetical protein
VEEVEREWASPKWISYRKHRPALGIAWPVLVEQTRVDSAYYYHPRITLAGQEIIEMAIVREENWFSHVDHKSIRRFYRRMDAVVGASSGEETNFVYVEWNAQGGVHGRPITADELRMKGAVI